MNRTILFFALILAANISFGQIGDAVDSYKISFAPFSPPSQDMIAMFEGNQATPFMANDQFQKEIYLGDLKGKAVLLWFWDPNNGESMSQFYDLNVLAKEFKGKPIEIIGFAKGNRTALNEFLSSHKAEFSIIPNAGILGEGPYAGELGYPRMFFLNRSGIIDKVLPSEAFTPDLDTQGFVRSVLNNLSLAK